MNVSRTVMCPVLLLSAAVLSVGASGAPQETVLRGLSPAQACEKIRGMKSAKTFPGHDVVVELEGTYSFTGESFTLGREDGGVSPNARVVFRGTGKGAVFTGALCLDRKSFKKVRDPAVRARLKPEVQNKVYCCDLKALGQDSIPVLPDQIRSWNSVEFIVDGEPQTLARYPNKGWLSFGFEDVVDRGVAENKALREMRAVRGGTFRYSADDPRPGSWDVSKGVWMLGYWNNDWTSDMLRIEKIDGEAHTITTKGIHYLGIGPKSAAHTVKRRYYFLNLLEELDVPGEWYVDCEKSMLYWYPANDKPAEIMFVNNAKPIVKATGLRNVAFENIRFTCNTETSFYLHNCENVTVDKCEVSYITRTGAHIQGGVNVVLSNSKIHHIGGHGIYMEAGNRRTLIPCRNRITNCEVYRSGRFLTSSRAIYLHGCGSRVDHNYIHDIPYSGISFTGNDHLIELNEIAFAMMESGDGGGIYTGRDWTSQGNVIRWNYIHHFGALGAKEKIRRGEKLFCEALEKDDSNGIYFDDCDSGDECYGNLIFKVGYGYQLGGGRDNYIHDNVIAGCMYSAALVDARGFTALRFEEGNQSLNGWNMLYRLNWIGWQKDPFRSKYPWTADYLTNDKFFPVRTSFSSNIVVNCKNLFSQGSCKERPNFVRDMNFRRNVFFGPTGPRDEVLYPASERAKYESHCNFTRDADFEKVCAEATDLRKVVGSKAFKKRFPDFPAIPVDDIGIKRGKLRDK